MIPKGRVRVRAHILKIYLFLQPNNENNNTKHDKMISEEIQNAISQFNLQGYIISFSQYGSGHIHDTYHLKNGQSNSPDYLLQKLNHNVFKNIPALIQNIKLVTSHIQNKATNTSIEDPTHSSLTLVPTKDGNDYFLDSNGNYWRIYYFLKNTLSYDRVETEEQAYEGGKAYGKFQALLCDMDINKLTETIPEFHNIVSRLNMFEDAVHNDPLNRVKHIKEEIAFVNERVSMMKKIYLMGEQKLIPQRITHNDTKFNNVLLSLDNKALCVIDLDTVMPGYMAYDFGDAVRTIVNTAEEDEKELTKINVNLKLLENFSRGFLQETKTFITNEEIESLYYGTFLLPYMIGLRFLTDYINGDKYFKIKFESHNLQRAKAQFRLEKCLEENSKAIRQIIDNEANQY